VFGGGRSQVGFGDQHPAPRRRRRRSLPAEASNGICPHLRLTPGGAAGCLGGLARWKGQCRGYGTAGTMPTTTRRSGPCALRTGPAGLDWGQSAPLMFLQEAAQLVGLGFEAAGLALVHVTRVTPGAGAGAAARTRTAVHDGAPAG
jgi:hypothetical protein